MRRIINNRTYSTDTSYCVGSWDSCENTSDLSYTREVLYRKRTGEYFLLGEGGAMSVYSESRGNGERIGSSEIIPLTYDRARSWAEKHLTAELYEVEFGIPEEDGSRAVMAVSLDSSLIERLRAIAAEKGCSLSSEVESRLRGTIA